MPSRFRRLPAFLRRFWFWWWTVGLTLLGSTWLFVACDMAGPP